MAILEAIQTVLGILVDTGEVTFKGISIYLLVKRVDKENKTSK